MSFLFPYDNVCLRLYRYDNLLLLRGLMDYACREQITYEGHDGNAYVRPLLACEPRVIFRSENEPLMLEWKYKCPFEQCTCNISSSERRERTHRGEKISPCPFARKIRILDSFLFLPHKLDDLIKGVHEDRGKKGIDLNGAFPVTMNFLRKKQLTTRQISLLINSKLSMPYESVKCFQDLLNTECPQPKDFVSQLKGTGPLEPADMQSFRVVWEELKIPNWLALWELYVQLDVLMACDAVALFFEKLFQSCRLHPLWYLTIRLDIRTDLRPDGRTRALIKSLCHD